MQIWVSTNASFRHDPVLKMKDVERNTPVDHAEKIAESTWGGARLVDHGPSLVRQALSDGGGKQGI